MAEVQHRVGIRGSMADIYAALFNPRELAGWWATSAAGTPEIGSTLDLNFNELVTLSFVICELQTKSLVHLQCVSGPNPWLGSQLVFTLEDTEDQVFVTLLHSNNKANNASFLYFST